MHANARPNSQAGPLIAHAARVRVTLIFALIVVSILTVLWPTTQSMIETWQRSATYGHCYIVIPIAIWMAWRQSAHSALVPLTPSWPGLIVIAAAGFAWLLGELASAAVVSQAAAVRRAGATVLTVLGRRWARQLAFPLGFLFFAVPFGEAWLPVLMEWTADVMVGALRASAIPVYREGNFFVVPSGSWSVIEACGGVRFLIAAMMTGCIFAWLQYRSLVKRLVFVALAVAAALLANWVRAYAMVILGHVSASRIAPGADHNLWGWLIFGVAMLGLFAVGMRWTDKDDGSRVSPARGGPTPTFSNSRLVWR